MLNFLLYLQYYKQNLHFLFSYLGLGDDIIVDIHKTYI